MDPGSLYPVCWSVGGVYLIARSFRQTLGLETFDEVFEQKKKRGCLYLVFTLDVASILLALCMYENFKKLMATHTLIKWQ